MVKRSDNFSQGNQYVLFPRSLPAKHSLARNATHTLLLVNDPHNFFAIKLHSTSYPNNNYSTMSTAEIQSGADTAPVKHDDHADSHDVKLTPFNILRYIGSIGLLIFSIIIVGALMFTGNTRVAKDANPWVSLIVCVSCL
jgi:hypothetical protein